MKKILIGLIALFLITIIPILTLAVDVPEGCNWTCDLRDSNCFWDCTCPKLYRVSYFNENHEWVTNYTYAFNRRQATDELGLKYGKCIVGRAFEWEL